MEDTRRLPREITGILTSHGGTVRPACHETDRPTGLGRPCASTTGVGSGRLLDDSMASMRLVPPAGWRGERLRHRPCGFRRRSEQLAPQPRMIRRHVIPVHPRRVPSPYHVPVPVSTGPSSGALAGPAPCESPHTRGSPHVCTGVSPSVPGSDWMGGMGGMVITDGVRAVGRDERRPRRARGIRFAGGHGLTPGVPRWSSLMPSVPPVSWWNVTRPVHHVPARHGLSGHTSHHSRRRSRGLHVTRAARPWASAPHALMRRPRYLPRSPSGRLATVRRHALTEAFMGSGSQPRLRLDRSPAVRRVERHELRTAPAGRHWSPVAHSTHPADAGERPRHASPGDGVSATRRRDAPETRRTRHDEGVGRTNGRTQVDWGYRGHPHPLASLPLSGLQSVWPRF